MNVLEKEFRGISTKVIIILIVPLRIINLYSFQVIKYCLLCNFSTENNLLRHLRDRHAGHLVEPAEASAKAICKIVASKSRSIINLVPMRVIKDAVSPFWDDRAIRAVCHK